MKHQAARIPIGRLVEHVMSPQVRGTVKEQKPDGYMVRTKAGLVYVAEFFCREVRK